MRLILTIEIFMYLHKVRWRRKKRDAPPSLGYGNSADWSLAQFPKLTEEGLILIEHYFYNEPEVFQRANDAANDYATVHEKFMDF